MSVSQRPWSSLVRTGLIAAGLLLAVPILATEAAGADTITITFSGQPLLGLSTLACPSIPSQATLTVTAGTTVNFANRTGKTATIQAGEARKDLPDKSLVPVTFGQGPAVVIVQMLPKCSLDLGEHDKLTVTVLPAVTGSPSGAPSGAPSGPPEASAAPSAAATRASHRVPVPSADPVPSATGATSSGAAAGHGTGTGGSGRPGGGSTATGTFAPVPVSLNERPVFGSAVGPATPRSASGLLTLIATVAVVGVSAAAIRAIIAQRANRTLDA